MEIEIKLKICISENMGEMKNTKYFYIMPFVSV